MTEQAAVCPPVRVLVVDDDVDTCELYTLALLPRGYDVSTAYDGDAALEQLCSETFDVAVLDLGLHKLDGHAVARAARLALGARTPYLVAVSGYGDDARRRASREAGFAEHHVKPFAPEHLVAVVERAILARAAGTDDRR